MSTRTTTFIADLAFALLFAALLIAAVTLTGCATNTGDPAKDKRGRITNAVGVEVFNAVLQFGLAEGASYVEGRNGQDAADAAFQAAGSIVSSQSLQRIIQAAAGPQIAAVAAQQFVAANPRTPADRALVINTIGAALQTATNQLAK